MTKAAVLFREMTSYGLIGIIASGADAILFLVLTERGRLSHLSANIVGVCVGITISFFLNRKFTFGKIDHTVKRYSLFFAVGMYGLALSEGILFIGTEKYGFSPVLVKLISIAIVAAFQFVLNKLISFRDFS